MCLSYYSRRLASVFIVYILCSGYYSGAAASSCDICPAGSYCSLTAATLCEPGSYSLEGYTNCTSCLPGHCQTYCERMIVFFVCLMSLLSRIMNLLYFATLMYLYSKSFMHGSHGFALFGYFVFVSFMKLSVLMIYL